MSHTRQPDIAYPIIRGRRQDLRVLDQFEFAYTIGELESSVLEQNEHVIRRAAKCVDEDLNNVIHPKI